MARPTTRSQTKQALSLAAPAPAPAPALATAIQQTQAEAEPASRKRKRRTRTDPWTPHKKPKPASARKPRAPPPTHYTCRICTELLPVDDFVAWVAPNRRRGVYYMGGEVPIACVAHLSRHPRKKNDPVCKPCISSFLAAKLETLGARKLSEGCLEPGCLNYWEQSYILRHLPPTAIETYNLDMFTHWRETNSLSTCPAESCNTISLIDQYAPGYPHVVCPSPTCALRYCSACNIPWHAGLTCAEYGARHIQAVMTKPELETLELMQSRDGKRCPNCYMVIEKDGGCDSMYCMGCRKYFNWAVAASAVPGSKPAHNPFPLFQGHGHMPRACEQDEHDQKAAAAAAGTASANANTNTGVGVGASGSASTGPVNTAVVGQNGVVPAPSFVPYDLTWYTDQPPLPYDFDEDL